MFYVFVCFRLCFCLGFVFVLFCFFVVVFFIFMFVVVVFVVFCVCFLLLFCLFCLFVYFVLDVCLHDCYPVCGMMHIQEPLFLIGKSSLCGGGGFPLSPSE